MSLTSTGTSTIGSLSKKKRAQVPFRFNLGDLVYHRNNSKMWGEIVGRGRFGETLEGATPMQLKWTRERVRDSPFPDAPRNWYDLVG